MAVSNGELIERTDAAGAYEIEAQPGIHRFLTVTLPGRLPAGGFSFSTDPPGGERDVPFRAHPLGEPSGRFAAAHITDLHLTTGEDGRHRRPGDNLASPDLLAGDIAEVEEELSPAFMLATGDLTNAGSIAELEAFRAVAEAAATPMHLGFGGHDAKSCRPGRGEEGGGRQRSPRLARRFQRGGDPDGVFREDTRSHPLQLRLRQPGISSSTPTRSTNSPPTTSCARSAGSRRTWRCSRPADRSSWGCTRPPRIDLLERLAKYDVRLVLHGHTHTSRVFRHRGIVIASTPSLCWGGSSTDPRGFRALHFDGDRFDMGAARCRRALEGRSQEAPAAGVPAAARAGSSLRPIWETRLPALRPSGRTGPLRRRPHSEPAGRRRRQGERRLPRRPPTTVRSSGTAAPIRRSATASPSRMGVVRHVELRPAVGPRRGDGQTPLAGGHPRLSGALDGRYSRCRRRRRIRRGQVRVRRPRCAHRRATWFRRFSGTLDLIADPTGDKWGAWFTPIVYGELLICLVPRRALTALDRKSGANRLGARAPGQPGLVGFADSGGDTVVSGGEPNRLLAVRAGTGVCVRREGAE